MIPFEYVEDTTIQRNFETINRLLGVLAEIPFFIGTGSPENVITASPPAIYLNRDGGAGTTLYVKESNVDDTGWAAK